MNKNSSQKQGGKSKAVSIKPKSRSQKSPTVQMTEQVKRQVVRTATKESVTETWTRKVVAPTTSAKQIEAPKARCSKSASSSSRYYSERTSSRKDDYSDESSSSDYTSDSSSDYSSEDSDRDDRRGCRKGPVLVEKMKRVRFVR